MPLSDLKTSYATGEQIALTELPAETTSVVARSARGRVWEANFDGSSAILSGIEPGTHAIEVWSENDLLIAEEITTVSTYPAENPVLGFATSFDGAATTDILRWLRALRCTVVQVYDWMASYSAPLAADSDWHDPLGRDIRRSELQELTAGIREFGAIAQAYAPVYAVDPAFGSEHPDWLLYRSDGAPQSLGDLLLIVNPGNEAWQQHWMDQYGAGADALGFNGFHLDTYGYPRVALDRAGMAISLEQGYASFLRAVRAARPKDVLSFNQVNGVPRGASPAGEPGFRYVEVWPPNDLWRHIEGLGERSAGRGRRQGDTFAIYPPVWGEDRSDALRTVLLTQAVVTVLGANALLYGDDSGVLRQPYYPDYERLHGDEARSVLEWNRFALRCRDLFTSNDDTTWYELGDENGAVSVVWHGATFPEPMGGGLFARVHRSRDEVVISLLDLTGSASGSWQSGTGRGLCQAAQVTVLVDNPEHWRAEAAVLGGVDSRFHPVTFGGHAHREGRAITCSIPVMAGWSVARFQRDW